MINISLNATKVKQELKRTFIGIALFAPVVAVFYAIKFLVLEGWLDKELVSTVAIAVPMIFLFWAVGGLVETIREQKEQETLRAFKKLGLNNDN